MEWLEKALPWIGALMPAGMAFLGWLWQRRLTVAQGRLDDARKETALHHVLSGDRTVGVRLADVERLCADVRIVAERSAAGLSVLEDGVIKLGGDIHELQERMSAACREIDRIRGRIDLHFDSLGHRRS